MAFQIMHPIHFLRSRRSIRQALRAIRNQQVMTDRSRFAIVL